MVGTGRPTVRSLGHNFEAESQVRFDGVPRVTHYISANQLVVTLVASDFSAPGTIILSVANGDQTSNDETLLVESPGESAGVWRFPSKWVLIGAWILLGISEPIFEPVDLRAEPGQHDGQRVGSVEPPPIPFMGEAPGLA